MTKEKFYEKVEKLTDKEIAEEMVRDLEEETNGSWNEELAEQWLEDLEEEIRFCGAMDHYRDCGY